MAVFGAASLVIAGQAQAATLVLDPTADGDVTTFGGDAVDTTDGALSILQSGGNITNAILEFDLGVIPDAATIDSVSLSVVLDRFVSNTGGNPAEFDVFAYAGDGVVDIADYDAPGSQVIDAQLPIGGSSGDVLATVFSDVSPVQALLIGDLLTLRLETDSFASVQIASLETLKDLSASFLTINYTVPEVSEVPVPAALPLLLSGIAGLGFASRRRKSA
ncbi:hypothetical protein CW354_22225 [Marinicaulis flavus]|uniref:PEP-CTERM protein-sorting domain-containing protein n=1 Tax=Hyphococcus luteus TaxID=2058213 RepID=A0A2S7JZG2_9PROT|nr:hypothetical protein CW354_22225 [Marinicaulis flavus]